MTTRTQAKADAELRDLAAVTEISDRQILRDLHRVGCSSRTTILLKLVPLVDRIEESDVRGHQLAHSLENRPADEFFRVTLRGLRASLEGLPPEEQGRRERKLIMQFRSGASVSGDFFRVGSKISHTDKSVISEIVTALERDYSPEQENPSSHWKDDVRSLLDSRNGSRCL